MDSISFCRAAENFFSRLNLFDVDIINAIENISVRNPIESWLMYSFKYLSMNSILYTFRDLLDTFWILPFQ